MEQKLFMGRTFISSMNFTIMFNWLELKVKGYLFVYPQFRSCVSVKTRAETFSTQSFPKLTLTQHTLIKSAPPTFPGQFNQICLNLVQSRKTGNVKLDRHGLRLEISIPETAKISTRHPKLRNSAVLSATKNKLILRIII